MKKVFVIVLRYVVPLEVIDTYREEHLKFLDRYYATGIFIASGPQVPRKGGIILAVNTHKEALETIIQEDPFFIHHLAQYQFYEFNASKYNEKFLQLLE